MPEIPNVLVLGAAGLAIGSFLNVCIYRLPRGQSVVTPPSRCTTCGRVLRWFENVPVLGYVALGGRCRMCGAPISVMYPAVEVATASLFLVHYWQSLLLGWPPALLFSRLVFASAMVVLFVVDLQHRILPNVITLPGVVAGFASSLFLPPGWLDALIGIAVGGGSLLAIGEAYYRFRGEEGLGMGDVKMLAMIGAFLGWQLMLVTLVLSSFLGSIVGVGLIVTKRSDMKYALPFGTFLAVGAITSSVIGESLLNWYTSFY